jgi:3-oxoacyl-[acyl-carrier protein] reductase
VDFGLFGRSAIVVGASAGLGRAIALALAAEGANVALFARRTEELEALAAEIGEQRALAVTGDSTDPAALEHLVETAAKCFGGVDIVINNTGGPRAGASKDVTEADWAHAFDLTLMSAVRLTRFALPALRASRRGRVVNVASFTVLRGEPRLLLSNALRRSVIGWAETLAREEARHGITVNSVAPGFIDTARLRSLHALEPVPAEARAAELARIPVGRIGRPEEVGATVAFLCSEQAAYITGVTLPIDSGFLT